MAVHNLDGKRRGIPTKYKGIQFRSLLEVRWAHFFDLMGWEYVYEPFDLEGWIPDFLLKGGIEVLVEVKPTTKFNEAVANKCLRAAQKGGWKGEILLLGAQPLKSEAGDFTLGWTNSARWKRWGKWWGEAPLYVLPAGETIASWVADFKGEKNGGMNPSKILADYTHKDADYGFRMCGLMGAKYLNDAHRCADASHFLEFLMSEWRFVQNQTQWKKPAA